MDLKHMRFFRAEGYINFTVFCDVPCRVRYLESIPVPMSASPVEVYAIEPVRSGPELSAIVCATSRNFSFGQPHTCSTISGV